MWPDLYGMLMGGGVRSKSGGGSGGKEFGAYLLYKLEEILVEFTYVYPFLLEVYRTIFY